MRLDSFWNWGFEDDEQISSADSVCRCRWRCLENSASADSDCGRETSEWELSQSVLLSLSSIPVQCASSLVAEKILTFQFPIHKPPRRKAKLKFMFLQEFVSERARERLSIMSTQTDVLTVTTALTTFSTFSKRNFPFGVLTLSGSLPFKICSHLGMRTWAGPV